MINLAKAKDRKGQIMVEFAFSMIVAMVMLFSVIMVFRWTGFDIGWRRVDHDLKLMNVVTQNFRVGGCLRASATTPSGCSKYQAVSGPIEQIDSYFHKPLRMGSAWGL